jgi:hypothetical protein
MKLDVVPPAENFRGMSYGDWAVLWSKWLLSEHPDSYAGSDVLFLRGNVDYKPLGGTTGGPRHSDPKGTFYRTGKNGERIFEDTAIFFPVVNAQLNIGELYDGRVIKDEDDARFAARKDINEGGPMWADITRKGDKKPSRIAKDLRRFRIESPLFKLVVSQKSQLRDKMESPLEPGTYDSVTVGYYILIRSLPPSKYRIHFGGKGRGAYYTNSVYDITVHRKKEDSVIDRSGQR